jgi:hypothetical protein
MRSKNVDLQGHARIGCHASCALHYLGNQRSSRFSPSSPLAISVIGNTSKFTAVDQPNSSTPFIAVIDPSRCQLIQNNNNTVTQRIMRNACQAALKVLAGLEDRILVATDAPLSFAGVFLI